MLVIPSPESTMPEKLRKDATVMFSVALQRRLLAEDTCYRFVRIKRGIKTEWCFELWKQGSNGPHAFISVKEFIVGCASHQLAIQGKPFSL